MNLAIVIGVSEYENEHQLPACKADAALVHALLNATTKYSDILLLNQNTSVGRVKEELRKFFAKYQDEEPDEVLVYFSGHGSYHTSLDDVLLCCSDFDSKKAASTSVTNGEIDDLLRSVSPKLAVKVYDACSSGAQYIKDAEAVDSFEKALRGTKLSAFYFMASSKLDQASFASAGGSHFTTTFVTGALSAGTGSVLYRDIQAFIADTFIDKKNQTPFFVTQGTGLEVFASVTPTMLDLRKRISGDGLGGVAVEDGEGDGNLKHKLSMLVSERDALFVSESDINGALAAAKAGLGIQQIHDAVVRSFYTLSFDFDGKLPSLPNVKLIAEWASEGNRQRTYFVQVITKREQVRLGPANSALAKAFLRPTGVAGLAPRTLERTVPSSISATRQLPYETVQIMLRPDGHPALRPHGVYIGFLHSRMELLVLSSPASFVETGWDEYSVDATSVKWQHDALPWREIIRDPVIMWKSAIARLEMQAKNYLESLLPAKAETKTEGVS